MSKSKLESLIGESLASFLKRLNDLGIHPSVDAATYDNEFYYDEEVDCVFGR